MKKLSLKMLRLTSGEVLERSQMKKITGGYGTVYIQCDNWKNHRPMPAANCGAGIIMCSGGWVCT
jgi:hypothetical protein